MERIGIIGLGRMGSAMASRFSQQGAPVTGWTRSGLSADRAGALGIAVARDLTELVAASDIVVLSLFDDDAVADVLDRLLSRDVRGKLIVDTSTVSLAPLKERTGAMASAGVSAVDAPISGGPEMVEAGVCGIFMGGGDAAVARADVALALLTERRFHIGALGTGLTMKMINNTLLQGYFATLRQLMPVAKRAGISLEEVLEILASGPAGNPFLRDRMPRILGRDDSVGFSLSGAAKDSDVFLAIAGAYEVKVEVLEAAKIAMEAGLAAGLGEEDPASLLAGSYHNA